MRTLIDLPKEQMEALAALCQREGISRAEAVRRAVALMLEEKKIGLQQALQDSFGMWKNRAIDGVEYQRELRAEWDGRGWDE